MSAESPLSTTRDAFISYNHRDKSVADAICALLERAGVRCWMAPRDISPGEEYAAAIIAAMERVKLLILVLSSSSNESFYVKLEVERAVSKGVTIIPFRIEDVKPAPAIELFVGARHWQDALTPPMEAHIAKLAEAALRLLGKQVTPPTVAAELPMAAPVDEPLLVFEYTEAGWMLRNLGKTPALDVLVAQKRVGGGWFKPVRPPTLEPGRNFPLSWCLHVNDTGLGVSYRTTSGAWLSSRCGNDRNLHYRKNILPKWTEEQIELHWKVSEYVPGQYLHEAEAVE